MLGNAPSNQYIPTPLQAEPQAWPLQINAHVLCSTPVNLHRGHYLCTVLTWCLTDEHLSGKSDFYKFVTLTGFLILYALLCILFVTVWRMDSLPQPFCCSQAHCTKKRGCRNQRLTPNQEESSPPCYVVTFLLWTTIRSGLSTVGSEKVCGFLHEMQLISQLLTHEKVSKI